MEMWKTALVRLEDCHEFEVGEARVATEPKAQETQPALDGFGGFGVAGIIGAADGECQHSLRVAVDGVPDDFAAVGFVAVWTTPTLAANCDDLSASVIAVDTDFGGA